MSEEAQCINFSFFLFKRSILECLVNKCEKMRTPEAKAAFSMQKPVYYYNLSNSVSKIEIHLN